MREIKFRAWDKESRRMFNIARFDFADHTVYSHLFSCEGYLAENLKIMQYTGLEDKNGREIYEGDVVVTDSYKTAMLKHWGANVENEEEKYVIKFERGSFRLCDLQTGDWASVIDHHVMSKVDKLSVIGNIYENPELLEVKK